MAIGAVAHNNTVVDDFVRDCSGLNFEVAHELIYKLRAVGLRPNCLRLNLTPRSKARQAAPASCLASQRDCSAPKQLKCSDGNGLWVNLPTDMVSAVTSLLGARDVLVASLVCSSWRESIGSTLTTLSLPPGLTETQLCGMLLCAARCCVGLRSLGLCRCSSLRDDCLASIVAATGATLKEVDLSGCSSISDTAISVVATSCRNLVRLDVSSCITLSDTAFQHIGECCSRLERLSACGCSGITDRGVMAVAQGCRSLQHVNFGWCELISSSGLRHLAENCSALQSVDLCGCLQVEDVCVSALASHCPRLSSLSLHCCRLVTDASILALTHHTTQLTYLNISGCRRVTAKALQCLLDAHPLLHTCKAKRNVIVSGCLKLLGVSCSCPKTLLSPLGSRWYHL